MRVHTTLVNTITGSSRNDWAVYRQLGRVSLQSCSARSSWSSVCFIVWCKVTCSRQIVFTVELGHRVWLVKVPAGRVTVVCLIVMCTWWLVSVWTESSAPPCCVYLALKVACGQICGLCMLCTHGLVSGCTECLGAMALRSLPKDLPSFITVGCYVCQTFKSSAVFSPESAHLRTIHFVLYAGWPAKKVALFLPCTISLELFKIRLNRFRQNVPGVSGNKD